MVVWAFSLQKRSKLLFGAVTHLTLRNFSFKAFPQWSISFVVAIALLCLV